MLILCQDRKRTKALNSPDFRAALKHLGQLETESIDAANKHWRLADAIDAVNHTYGEPEFSNAFTRMLALLPMPGAEHSATPADTIRFRHGLRSIFRTLASSAVAGVVMFGLTVAVPTSARVEAATPPETATVLTPDPEQAKRKLAQLAAVIRGWVSEIDAFARPVSPASCATSTP